MNGHEDPGTLNVDFAVIHHTKAAADELVEHAHNNIDELAHDLSAHRERAERCQTALDAAEAIIAQKDRELERLRRSARQLSNDLNDVREDRNRLKAEHQDCPPRRKPNAPCSTIPANLDEAIRAVVQANERSLEEEVVEVARNVARDGMTRTLRDGLTISRKPRSFGEAIAATVKTEDVHRGLHLAKLIDGVHADGGAVEIGGVKIEKCDAQGRTEADHLADKWRTLVGMFDRAVPAPRTE